MKNLFFVAIAMCLCLPAMSQDWELIWSDEFDGESLDLDNWSYETGTGVNGDWGTGQQDRATDRPENVDIEQGIAGADGGVLRITTRKEQYIDKPYTSGRINSKGKASWGPNHRIVARVWPQDVRYMGQGFAFWMMPDETRPGEDNISWPQGGEIDIMEYVGSIPEHNLGSVHYAWDWNNNEWANWNHGHHGGYYSFEEEEVQDSPEWLQIDLGQVVSVNRIVVNWENTGKVFEIQTSTDGAAWSAVYTTSDGDGGTDEIAFAARSARYVRMYGTQRANDWGYSIFELAVYGPDGNTNLALNRPASASSSQASDLPASNAVDGSESTRWSSSPRNPQYQCCNPSSTTDPNVGANGWHEYGIDWYSDRMEFFIDGNVYHIHYFNDGAAFEADGENETGVRIIDGRRVYISEFSNLYPEWHPFEHKMYAILSSGAGGGNTYGGPIVDEAEFPVDVYVDWVRVYSNGETFNPPPAVSMSAPSGTETYAAPASITLSAEATDQEGGTIRSVSFYNGGELLGTDTSQPFSLQWNNVPAGVYSVKAVAEDNGGATAQSQTVTVAVNGPNSNLALNRPGTASGVTGAFTASNAFDGDGESRWESAYEDPQWIYVDLGNTYDINRVKIVWETALGKDYQIQVSSDATNWQTIKTVAGNAAAENDLTGLAGSGRYVRMYGTARNTTYGYSIFSMEVYGEIGESVACGDVNIALNKTAVASSVEGGFNAASAIDGNPGTRWGSAFTDDEWLRVDLGGTYTLCEVTLAWEAAFGRAYELRLGSSTEITASQVIATVSNGDGGTDAVTTDNSVSGRYLWMKGVGRGTGYGYSLWEMDVSGVPATTTARTAQRKDKAVNQEVTTHSAATLYPNPVAETLHIRTGQEGTGNKIEIVSLLGKTMLSRSVDTNELAIDVSTLPSGVYMLRWQGTQSNILRFVKQ